VALDILFVSFDQRTFVGAIEPKQVADEASSLVRLNSLLVLLLIEVRSVGDKLFDSLFDAVLGRQCQVEELDELIEAQKAVLVVVNHLDHAGDVLF